MLLLGSTSFTGPFFFSGRKETLQLRQISCSKVGCGRKSLVPCLRSLQPEEVLSGDQITGQLSELTELTFPNLLGLNFVAQVIQ